MITFCPGSPSTGLVSVDWLSIQAKSLTSKPMEEPTLPMGLVWSNLKPTNVWQTRGYILDSNGNKLCTVLANPFSKIIPQDNVQLDIANRLLYQEDTKEVVTSLMQYCNVSPYGLNRVDLCCDFEMRFHLWKALTLLSRGDAYLKGMRVSNAWYEQVHGRRVCYDMNWGALESTYRWKLYYKWWELQQADATGKKPYITALWREAGFMEDSVWRVEVSIHNSNGVRMLDNSRIPLWDWIEKRTTIFQSLYADKFVIRKNEGHKDKRNDTIVPFLDINATKMLRRNIPAEKNTDSDPEKRIVCKLWRELQEVDTQANPFAMDVLRTALRELVQNDGNLWILNRMYGVTIRDVERALFGGG